MFIKIISWGFIKNIFYESKIKFIMEAIHFQYSINRLHPEA